MLGGIAATVCCFDRVAGILANALVLPSFVATTNPYGAVAFFFESSLAPSFDAWALGVWLATLGRLAERSRRGLGPARPVISMRALLWCLCYTALMLSLNYFPNRYKVHVIVPMAICIGLGLPMLQRAGVAAVGVAANQQRAKRLGWRSPPGSPFRAPPCWRRD